MHLHELKGKLVKKKYDSMYLFTGEEVGIMDVYIKMIARDLTIKRVDSLSSIFSRLSNNSVMGQASCYIIRDDKEYLKAEKQWDLKKRFGKKVVIMIYTNVDKRGKFYKQHKDEIVTFDKLPPEVLSKYITKEVELSPTLAVQMAEMCQCNYTRILLECDKLIHLANATGTDHTAAYQRMKDEGLLFIEATDVVFDLIDAVTLRQPRKAYALLDEFKEFSDSPLGAITLLYNNFRNILLVQGYKGSGKISEATGLTGWQASMASKKKGK